MKSFNQLSNFAKFSWLALVYNLVVILWGVFLRASKSGDGCGQHWLTCHGEIIPSAPEMKTVIEFSHRLSSGLAFLVVLVLVIWAFRAFPRGAAIRRTALVSFVFIVTEALVGAGLVLTGNTAVTLTATRPLWMAGHLMNTFILLAFLTLTARFASGGRSIHFRGKRREVIALSIGIAGILIIGSTGSIAALSHMIFPSESLISGIQTDFSESSHLLLRLRVLHPISSVVIGVFLFLLAGWIKRMEPDSGTVSFWSGAVSLLVLIQLAVGGLTLVMGAPIIAQVVHLLFADCLWISYVLLSAAVLSTGTGNAE